MVKGFPETCLDEQRIKKFFEKFGKVRKISFAYKFNNTIENLIKIVKYKSKLRKLHLDPKRAEKKTKIDWVVRRLKKEVKDVTKKL